MGEHIGSPLHLDPLHLHGAYFQTFQTFLLPSVICQSASEAEPRDEGSGTKGQGDSTENQSAARDHPHIDRFPEQQPSQEQGHDGGDKHD